MDKRTNTDDEEMEDAVMHADDTGMLREQHEIIEKNCFPVKACWKCPMRSKTKKRKGTAPRWSRPPRDHAS